MSWGSDVRPQHGPPPPPPCVVLRDPESDSARCGGLSGGHTILDFPLCDACWSAVRLEEQ